MKRIDNQAELKKMVRKYLAGKATPEQEKFLEAYFEHFENREDILEHISNEERFQLREEIEEALLTKISKTEKPHVTRLHVFLPVAATILIFLSVGLYFYYSNKSEPAASAGNQQLATDVEPGGNRAWLTLADGTKISLDEAGVGELSRQGSAVIRKRKDGQIIYDLSGSNNRNGSATATNAIETPRGGEYQLILPDGTKVWLNAASKLVFPTAFEGKERRVELTGEAYFEVAKNKYKPFRVSSKGQVVKVLGTHFNVSAYPDDAIIRTTLLEGSVRVDNFSMSRTLVPGQQATVDGPNSIFVASVNPHDAIAWKNGYFVFSNEGLESVMRKISRWYNVEVEYRGKITKEGFVGTVSRFEKISEVLSVLELTGLVNFKVEEGRIIVMP